jgi:hypothetical protein
MLYLVQMFGNPSGISRWKKNQLYAFVLKFQKGKQTMFLHAISELNTCVHRRIKFILPDVSFHANKRKQVL